MIDQGRIQ